MTNPIPNIVLHPQFVGTTDSADFQGPIAKHFSDDFHHFSLKSPPNMMVTPYRRWYSAPDSAVLPIRPIFRVRSPDPFLMIFAIFSLKSPPNIHSGQRFQLMRVQRAIIACFYRNGFR